MVHGVCAYAGDMRPTASPPLLLCMLGCTNTWGLLATRGPAASAIANLPAMPVLGHMPCDMAACMTPSLPFLLSPTPLQIPDEVEFEVTFRCRAPCTTDTIQLEGMSSYDAATHCASLMAAQRLQAHGSGSTSVAAGAAAAAGAGAPAPAAPTSSTSSSSHGSSGGPAQQHHHHHPHGAPATPGMHVQAYSPAHAPSAAIATPLATCQPSGCPQPPPTPFHAHHQQQLQQPPQSAFLYAQQQGELAAAAQAQPVLHYSHPAHCGTPIAAPASSLGHPTLRRSPRNHHTPTPIASQCS